MNRTRFAALCVSIALLLSLLAPAAIAEDTVSLARPDVGVNFIERKGLGFSLDKEMKLRKKDVLETRAGSEISLSIGESSIYMNENSQLKVLTAEPDDFSAELQRGEAFIIADAANSIRLKFADKEVLLEDGVLLLSVYSGSENLSVLRGSVSGEGFSAESGETISFTGGQSERYTASIGSLDAFALRKAIAAAGTRTLCYSAESLQKLSDDREAERRAAIEAALLETQKAKSQQSPNSAAASNNQPEATAEPTPEPARLCTIQIRCDTILDNMDNLKEGKDAYVPANGVILSTSSVAFEEGETVFDILTRACDAAGIQMEYRWTPMYNSYYIEGINHLYEFDCGEQSGWMYKVNGWFPNYGCSAYTVKDGDSIVWCYTCNGLGADVGGGMY